MKLSKIIYVLAGTAIILFSCKKDLHVKNELKADEQVTFPQDESEKLTVAVISEVGTILKEVYKNPKAYYEVCAAIYSGYYSDERVLLKDLLFPERSRLYKTQSFKKLKSEIGVFKKEFLNVLENGEFVKLKNAMGLNINKFYRTSQDIPYDTAREIYTNGSGVSIYFPYSENFSGTINASYFDNINTDPFGYMATIVSADREADSGPGSQPYRYKTNENDDVVFIIKYRNVTVDDSYAELNTTHIVGIGAQTSPERIAQPQGTYLVFIGEVRCNKKNYDKLITFNGYLQGGGPDLRFCRGSGYLTQDGNGQILGPQNVVQANPTRKQCKKSSWISVYSIWDGDWQIDNLNQVFAIYEEDKKGTKTFSLSLKTTVKIGSNTTGEGTVGFNWTFNTEDDIIRQLGWNRQSFFNYNQGGLNNGCGLRNGFTVYDCNSTVAYTMPTQ